MVDLLFVLCWLGTPLIALFFLKNSKINIFRPSIISTFVAFYLIFAYIGTIALYFNWDYRGGPIRDLEDRELILLVFFYSAICLILIAIGCYLACHVLRIRIYTYDKVTTPLKPKGFYLALGMVALCTVVLMLYMSQLPAIPLLEVLNPSRGIYSAAKAASSLRSSATHGFEEGNYYRYSLFIDQLLPFLTFVLFSHTLVVVKRKKTAWLIWFSIFSLAFFASLMLIIKARVFWLCFGLLFTYLLTKGFSVKVKYLVISIPIGFSILFLMYIYFRGMAGASINQVFYMIFNRIFAGQIQPAYFYLEMFPIHHDYLFGRSIPNPGGLFPYERYNLSLEVMKYMAPGLSVQGAAPTVYWGEVYANFGALGAFIVSPILGIFLYSIEAVVSRLYPSPVKPALISWLALYYFSSAALSNISKYIVPVPLVLIGVASIIILAIEGKGRIKILKKKSGIQQTQLGAHGKNTIFSSQQFHQ